MYMYSRWHNLHCQYHIVTVESRWLVESSGDKICVDSDMHSFKRMYLVALKSNQIARPLLFDKRPIYDICTSVCSKAFSNQHTSSVYTSLKV